MKIGLLVWSLLMIAGSAFAQQSSPRYRYEMIEGTLSRSPNTLSAVWRRTQDSQPDNHTNLVLVLQYSVCTGGSGKLSISIVGSIESTDTVVSLKDSTPSLGATLAARMCNRNPFK